MPGPSLLRSFLSAWQQVAPGHATTDAASGELRARRLSELTRLTPWLMGANISVGLVVLLALGPSQPLLLCWFVALLALCGRSAWRQRQPQMPKSVSVRAVRHAIAHTALLALVWSLLPVLWLPGATPVQQMLVAAVICGVMGAGAFALSSVPQAASVWLGVQGVATAAVMLVSGQSELLVLALLLLLYGTVVAALVWHAARQFNSRLASEREAARQGQLVSLLLRDFEEHATDVLWEIDRSGQFSHVSARLAQMLGRSETELQRSKLLDLLGARAVESEQAGGIKALRAAMTRGKPFRDVLLQVQSGEATRWWTITAKPLMDDAGRGLGWRGVLSDVTQQRRTHQRLAYLAHYDSLTGLANRVQLRERLSQALEARGDPPRRSALLCLDLDHFKSINDSLGHSVGDGVLRLVAQRLQSVVRRSDLIARVGGDEFAVLLDDVRSDAEVHQLAQRLVQVLCAPGDVRGRSVDMSASIGVAFVPDQGSTIDEALGNADLALYAAKEAGRGRCEYFAPWLGERHRRTVAVEAELRHALERGEFSLAWQPWVQTSNWQICSAEALLRWTHPELGAVPPSEFIPVAEKAGLIGDIGAWVLARACTEAQALLPPLPISVNVSPMQMLRPELIDEVQLALSSSGLPPDRLEIEITEGIFLDDTPTALANLHALKRLGVKIALDDFGTGYSSLAYLRRFPFDTLKIDRAFVRELMSHRDARSIVRTIVDLARVLGMRTVAEGVEEPAQLAVLNHAGCHAIQGYLVARPQPAAAMRALLHRWDSRNRPEADDLPSSVMMPLDGMLSNLRGGR